MLVRMVWLLTLPIAYGQVSVSLSSTPNPSAMRQAVTLTANVSPSGQSGKVTFFDGTAVLGAASIRNGVATFTTSAPGAGRRFLSARYVLGVGEPSTLSNTVTQTVSVK